MSESFFSRWSRRKQALAEEAKAPPAASVSPAEQPEAAPPPPAAPAQAQAGRAAGAEAAPGESTLPTLEDVRSLTPQSDFQPFMQPGVGSAVRNAAMKKLFADPHFNVMDGLDIYIDDYSLPDPMPEGMLARMASAQFMKLVPEPAAPALEGAVDDAGGLAASPGASEPRHPQDPLGPGGPEVVAEVVAQSPLSSPNAAAPAPNHDHPDLQLQPDLAPADPVPGSRPG